MAASAQSACRLLLLAAMPAAAFAIVGCTAAAACAQTVEQFYKGRTITLRIPAAPGGINDIAGRLVARYLGDHIPGHPSIVPQNQPGAGGMISANRLYNTTERDGSVISIVERGTPLAALQGDPNAMFDPLKFNWLGSISSYANDAYMLIVNSSNPVRTVDDLRKGSRSITLGGQHAASTNLEFALIAKIVLGLNIDVVRGYTGAAPMFLAMQRGEIDGQVIGLSSVRAGQPQLWDGKLLRPLVQFARDTRLPDLADVPTGQELAPDTDAKALIAYAEVPFHMALPFAAPPGVPKDRADALRSAFAALMKDPAFIAAAEKVNLDVSPIGPEAVRDILVRSAATPKSVIAHFMDVTSGKAGR